MIFDPVAKTLTLDKIDCGYCDLARTPEGKVFGRKTCLTCKGTGKGPRGKARGCRQCFGRGQEVDFASFEDCPVCHGAPERAKDETWCDTAPHEAVQSIPVIVTREDRSGTFNEGYLGLGCLWSTTDYGTAWESPDQVTLVKVLSELATDRVQATNIVARGERSTTESLVDALIINITRSGYAVRPSKAVVAV